MMLSPLGWGSPAPLLALTGALLACSLPSGVSAQISDLASGRCESPNVLLLLDRSGSMLDDDKWGQAQRALEGSILPASERLRFGVLTFPWGMSCGVSPEALRVPVGELSAEALGALFTEALPVDTALTPLAGAIDQGRELLNALGDRNRRGVLILLTDGVETCADGGAPNSEAPRFAAEEAVADGYTLYTIGFGSLVSQRTLRELAELGGTGRERRADDAAALTAVLEEIIQSVSGERCDLLDNDCDGRVDEALEPLSCEGACGAGERRCVEGVWSECVPLEPNLEVCDGLDNDCDGYSDEDLTFSCDLGGEQGFFVCDENVVQGERGPQCLPLPEAGGDPLPVEEGCDGADNDGDGRVDEGTEVRCSEGCHEGRRSCVDGQLIGCSAPPVGEERCNAYDDDCDGLIDEQNPCPGAERCGEEGLCLPPCDASGGCDEGFVCGADGYCASAPCESGCAQEQLCVAGQCVQPCAVNVDCPSGQRCEDRRCVMGDGGGTREPSMSSSDPTPPAPTPTPTPAPTPAPTPEGGAEPVVSPGGGQEAPSSAQGGCAQRSSRGSAPISSALLSLALCSLLSALSVRRKRLA